MADFYEVHRDALNAAKGRLRVGEQWSIALREPAVFVNWKDGISPSDTMITVVKFIACAGGILKPSTELDLAAIANWKRKYRETPSESFGLPAALTTPNI